MIRILATLILFLTLPLHAQWQQTNGISGGYFTSILSANQNLIAATGNGSLFRLSGSEWHTITGDINATSLHRSGSAIVGLNYAELVVSTDDGISWTKRPIPQNLSYEAVVEDDGILTLNTSGDSIFQSLDLGATWMHLPASTSFFDNGTERTIFSFMDIYKSGNTLYANAMTDDPVNMLILLESSNSGETWNVSFRPVSGDLIVHIISNGSTTLVTTVLGVYKRTGSSSWEVANGGLPVSQGSSIISNIRIANGTIYAFFPDANNNLYKFNEITGVWEAIATPAYANDITIYLGNPAIATAGKVFHRVDGTWISKTDDLIATTSIPLAFNDKIVFTQHGGTTYRTTDGGMAWESIAGLTGRIHFNGNELLTVSSEGLMRSTDLGISWSLMNSGIPLSYIPKSNDIAASGTTLYAGFNGTRRRDHLPAVWEQGGIYRSTDNGASWSAFNSGIVHDGGVPAPVLNIWTSDSRVMMRTLEGTYTLSGNTWTRINNTFPTDTYYSTVIIRGDSLIVGSNHGLMVSVNNGASWQMLKHGLPATGINLYFLHYFRYLEEYYAFDYLNDNMYKLSDTTWAPAGFSIPGEMSVAGFSSAGNILYAGMIDHGIWKYNKTQTGIGDNAELPGKFRLDQNYPNPFNPATLISFALPASGGVTLRVFSITGEMVRELVNGDMEAGEHRVSFDAGDLNSGVFFYTLSYAGKSQSGKMILMK